MRPSALVLFLTLVSLGAFPLHAQRPELGILVGHSFVGGGDSRVLVETGQGPLTGGDQAGLHVRAFADVPVSGTALAFRFDAFYNRLTSPIPAVAFVAGRFAPAARLDRTLGLTGSFVLSTSRTAAVAPYVSLGAGLFVSRLEGDVFASGGAVSPVTVSGMGLGLAAGGGLVLRLWSGPRVVLDWRYQQALNSTRGAGFMPLSVGLRF